MTMDTADDPALGRSPRRDDGLIYKLMGFVVFLVFVPLLVFGGSLKASAAAHLAMFLACLFVFDAGWDMTCLASGRRDMLVAGTPRLIIGAALRRTAHVGLCLLVFELAGEMRLVAGALVLAGIAADVLLRERACG